MAVDIQGVNFSTGVQTQFRVAPHWPSLLPRGSNLLPRWTMQGFGRSYDFEAPCLGMLFPQDLRSFRR